MIQSIQFRICILDNKPPSESEVYQILMYEHGSKVANRWTQIIKVVMPAEHHLQQSRYAS